MEARIVVSRKEIMTTITEEERRRKRKRKKDSQRATEKNIEKASRCMSL